MDRPQASALHARALMEGRGGRETPPELPELADAAMLRAKLWANPCWFSFRLNYLSLHFNNPVYGFINARLDLQRPDFAVLWSLHVGGDGTLTEVVQSSGFPKNTLSRAANKLARLNLISREVDPADQRRVTLSLTAAGRDAIAAVQDQMIAQERRMLETLSPSERLMLSDILTKLVAASESWPETIDGAGTAEDDAGR